MSHQVCTYAKKYHDEDEKVERPVHYSNAYTSKELVLSIMEHERTEVAKVKCRARVYISISTPCALGVSSSSTATQGVC
jgi:hypothetical protein